MAAGAVEANVTTNTGKIGAYFDGVDDKIDLSAIPEIDKDKPFSVALDYYKTNDDPVLIFTSVKGGTNRFAITAQTGIAGGIYNGAAYRAASTTGDPANRKWYNIVYTYNGANTANSDSQLYIDGVLQTGTGTPAPNATAGVRIGMDTGGGKIYKGTIGNMKVWSRLLSPTEAITASTGAPVQGMIHHWKLATDYKDSVGSNDGTNDGTHFAIIDDAIEAAIKADRTTANDTYLLAKGGRGQIVSAVIEENP